jgi:signal transduction histidine kinase
VPLRGSKDELDQLAAAFNIMVEKIQRLVTGMKQVTDNVAHDLRSPVTSMRGLAEVTRASGGSTEEYQTMAESVVEQCDRLLAIINTMLEIAEAEAGVVQLRIQEVDMAQVAHDACDLFQVVAEDKGVTMTVEASGPARLYGDLQKLQRVLANLLDNAVKYTQSGGKIALSVVRDENEVTVAVSDTGIGIAEEDLLHIFDRFYRTEKSRSEPGIGLGLCLARAFVSAHGGVIAATSRPGKGSTFTVSLPLNPPSR